MATSNADFYRAQYAQMNNEQRHRQNAMTDDVTKSQYDTLANALTSIQNDPNLAPAEKTGRINAIRAQQLKIMSPGLAKRQLAEMQQRFGITDTGTPQTGTVPAQAPFTLSAPPSQGAGPAIQNDEGESIQLGAPGGGVPNIQLPGKQATQVSLNPMSANDAMAGTAPPNPLAIYRQQLIQAGLPPDQADKAIKIKAGLEAPQKMFAQHSGQWETVYGTKGGQPFQFMHSKATGQNVDMGGTPLDEGDLEGFQLAPRPSSAAPKTPNRDDQAIAIMQRQLEAKYPNLTPDQSYKMAYDQWVKETKIDPRVQGYAALNAGRYIPVIDPNDPNQQKVTPMRVGDAAKQHVSLPASIPFQVDKILERTFTSGKTADTLTAFNTAIKHLDQLKGVATALDNGDITLVNRLGQAWGAATGNPAPSNFESVRNGVAGEIAKAFKGAGASDQEIASIVETINKQQSPRALMGSINEYSQMLRSKRDVLHSQYNAGKAGQPNFGDNPTPPAQPPAPPTPPTPPTPGALKNKGAAIASGYVRIQDSKGGLHDIPQQNLNAAKQRDPGLKVINP